MSPISDEEVNARLDQPRHAASVKKVVSTVNARENREAAAAGGEDSMCSDVCLLLERRANPEPAEDSSDCIRGTEVMPHARRRHSKYFNRVLREDAGMSVAELQGDFPDGVAGIAEVAVSADQFCGCHHFFRRDEIGRFEAAIKPDVRDAATQREIERARVAVGPLEEIRNRSNKLDRKFVEARAETFEQLTRQRI